MKIFYMSQFQLFVDWLAIDVQPFIGGHATLITLWFPLIFIGGASGGWGPHDLEQPDGLEIR